MEVNDENILFIPGRLLASKYMAEFLAPLGQGYGSGCAVLCGG
jgi:hypothetical protein